MAAILKTIYFVAHMCMVSNPTVCKDSISKKERTTIGECYTQVPHLLKDLEEKSDGWALESFMCTSSYKVNI